LNSIRIHVKLYCSRGLYLKCIYCHCCHQSAVIFICTALDNGTTVRVYIWTPCLLRSAHLQTCVMGLKSNLLPSIRWRGPVQVAPIPPCIALAITAQHTPPQVREA
jgi:hypothetical protein